MSAVLAPAGKSPIPAPNILLMGPGGTGKTYAIRTLVDAGITPFILSLDPGGLGSIGDIPATKLHWHVINPVAHSWQDMIQQAKTLGNLTFEGITASKDFQKGKQMRYINVLETLASFKDDRTGTDFGPVDNWPTSRALVIDHFTELCVASKEWAVGNKLVLHQGEWQVAQNNIENLVRNLTIVCRCWVVVIAHVDRETDLVLGGSKIMVHALGKALAPKLPPLFSDVIMATREGAAFTWDTAAPGVDLKTSNLAIAAKLPPSFSPIVEKWKSRGGVVEP